MREIWVGNLPQDINEKTLKKAFSVYGEVDNVEIFQKPNLTFAFLRYKRSKEALMAFESVDHLSIVLKSTLRIAFSDYQKRAGIVGDCTTVTDVSLLG